MTADTAATAALGPEPITGSGPGAIADDTAPPGLGLPAPGKTSSPPTHLLAPDPAPRPHRHDRPGHRRTRPPLRRRPAVACGNRREAVCPACSAVYKRDARQLVRAGLAGGKGIPETITAHPCVFATLTAPSFGPVHARRMRGKTVLPCRPRRDANDPPLPARPRHLLPDPARRGRPPARPADVRGLLRLRSRRAVQRLRGRPVAPVHHLPAPAPGPAGRGDPEDCCAASSASGSSRSLSTRRAASSTSTPSSAWTHPARTTSPRPPPTPLTCCATPSTWPPLPPPRHRPRGPGRDARLRPADRHPDHPSRQRLPGTGQALNGAAVANYIAKYATKTLTAPGLPSQRLRREADIDQAALLGPLPAADHHRLAARRHPPGSTVPGLGAHARLRRPLPDQIPPLLRHLRPAPPRPHRPPPRRPAPGRRPRRLGPAPG